MLSIMTYAHILHNTNNNCQRKTPCCWFAPRQTTMNF